jgi:hypothetical protein
MDGLVLVLAIILNPRSKKAVQRGEQKSRAGASISNGRGGDDGSGTRRAAVRAMPASGGHDDKERSSEVDHLTPITA